MAAIIIEFDSKVDHNDLNILRRRIVSDLEKQGLPIVVSYTNDMRQFDIISSQNDNKKDS